MEGTVSTDRQARARELAERELAISSAEHGPLRPAATPLTSSTQGRVSVSARSHAPHPRTWTPRCFRQGVPRKSGRDELRRGAQRCSWSSRQCVRVEIAGDEIAVA
jgi:hypothetical protein